jgi:hypothetical protein
LRSLELRSSLNRRHGLKLVSRVPFEEFARRLAGSRECSWPARYDHSFRFIVVELALLAASTSNLPPAFFSQTKQQQKQKHSSKVKMIPPVRAIGWKTPDRAGIFSSRLHSLAYALEMMIGG